MLAAVTPLLSGPPPSSSSYARSEEADAHDSGGGVIVVPGNDSVTVVSTPAFGQVSLTHDRGTGAIAIDFERLDSEDAVMPRFRLDITTQHAAAWVGKLLRERWGRRCKEIRGRHDGRRFALALRLTAQDSGLVYYTHTAEGLIILRGGRVLKVPLRMDEGMGSFEGRLGEMAMEARQSAVVGEELADFVAGLVV